MIELASWFLGQHIFIMFGLLFMLGLLIGMMGTLLVRDSTSNDTYDEMDEIPEEKEKAEFVVCWKNSMEDHLKWR